jgi:hypothetical protein
MSQMKAVHQDLIRQRAYEIWDQNGRPHGRDAQHWAQAERELLDAAPEIKATRSVKSATRKGREIANPDAGTVAKRAPQAKQRGESVRVR